MRGILFTIDSVKLGTSRYSSSYSDSRSKLNSQDLLRNNYGKTRLMDGRKENKMPSLKNGYRGGSGGGGGREREIGCIYIKYVHMCAYVCMHV